MRRHGTRIGCTRSGTRNKVTTVCRPIPADRRQGSVKPTHKVTDRQLIDRHLARVGLDVRPCHETGDEVRRVDGARTRKLSGIRRLLIVRGGWDDDQGLDQVRVQVVRQSRARQAPQGCPL